MKPARACPRWAAALLAIGIGLALAAAARADFRKAFSLLQQGNLNAALNEFALVREQNPTWYFPYLGLGSCYRQMGKTSEARAHLDKALELAKTDSEKADVRLELAQLAKAQGNPVLAVGLLEQVLAAGPPAPQRLLAESLAGELLLTQKKYAEAVPHLQAAIALQPADFKLRYNLGVAAAGAGRSELAADNYAAAYRLKPDHPELAYHLARAHLQRKDFGAAMNVALKYETENPRDPKALELAGQALMGQKRYGDAAQRFQALVELDPKNGAAALNLAQCLGLVGKWREAIDAAKSAQAAGIQNAAVYDLLGKGYEALAVRARNDRERDQALEEALKAFRTAQQKGASVSDDLERIAERRRRIEEDRAAAENPPG